VNPVVGSERAGRLSVTGCRRDSWVVWACARRRRYPRSLRAADDAEGGHPTLRTRRDLGRIAPNPPVHSRECFEVLAIRGAGGPELGHLAGKAMCRTRVGQLGRAFGRCQETRLLCIKS
jgi:hypothetical protein